jgi:hypothetical protein
MTHARVAGRAGKATQIYERADKWRSFIRVMATIGGFLAFVALINGSNRYGEFDGGAFMTGLITYSVAIAVGTMPYFILARVLDGVGSVVEEATALHNDRDRAVRELAQRAESVVSVEAARVAAAIAVLGNATIDQIGERVGVDEEDLAGLLEELLDTDLIESSRHQGHGSLRAGAVYAMPGNSPADLGVESGGAPASVDTDRPPDPARQASEPRYPGPPSVEEGAPADLVFCETCGYPISRSLLDSLHRGHSSRPV